MMCSLGRIRIIHCTLAASPEKRPPRNKIAKNFVNWDKRKQMKRDKAIETVKEFPQEFELEDLIERLVFLEKVEKGLQQVEQGKTIPHEKVKAMTKKW